MAERVIGMLTSYSAIRQADWLWQQTPQFQGRWGQIQMLARAPQPDFLLLYQYDFPDPNADVPELSWGERLRQWKAGLRGDRPTPAAPSLEQQLRGVPKERIIYLLREPPLDEVVAYNRVNYAQAQQHCGYVSGPDDAAPIPDYMPAIWYLNNSFRELNEMPPPPKVATCSWITSGIDRTANHRKRLQFLRNVQESGLPVELFGRDLPPWVQSVGTLGMKWYAMAPYFYNLAIENYADNQWYVSEKLWDALLSWCLPIYYGGAGADRLVPPESFLRLPSLDEKGLAYIREVTASPDLWYERKEAIAEARQIILHKLNLLNWLSDYVGRFE